MIKLAGATHPGLVREQNQDSFVIRLIDENTGYAIVCDGMGGENAGDVASSIACQAIDGALSGLKPGTQPKQIKRMLQAAVSAANAKVYHMAQEDQLLRGMGTTLSMVVVSAGYLCAAHAGDSRIFQISPEGEVTQLTQDHTFVNDMVQRGELTPKEALVHPKKHFITRALGVSPKLDFDYIEEGYQPKTQLLVCTDGLSNYLLAEDIPSLVAEYDCDGDPDVFIRYANSQGGGDNITAVMIQLDV